MYYYLTLAARGPTSDVRILLYRRQIPSLKSIPALKSKIFIMGVESNIRYSNEAERANEDINDDFKLKNPLVSWSKQIYLSTWRVRTENIYLL